MASNGVIREKPTREGAKSKGTGGAERLLLDLTSMSPMESIIRSIRDLFQIGFIPVNNKNTQSVVYFLKDTIPEEIKGVNFFSGPLTNNRNYVRCSEFKGFIHTTGGIEIQIPVSG